MDQQKTGKFIAEMRKEKGLTQRELAEKLSISDRTVSKWECGNGFPEISLMLPLCEVLDISVNELLSGKRLHSEEYQKHAEVNIMSLMQERKEAKRNLGLSIFIVLVTFLGGITLILLSGLLEMETWLRIVLIVIGFITLLGGIAVAVVLEVTSGAFECQKCQKRFMPTLGAYIAGAHTPTKRWLKCPHCGEKSWCVRRMSLTKEESEE